MATKKIKGNLSVESELQLPAETSQRALVVDSTGKVTASPITETELGRLTGVTSDVQTQLNAKVDDSEKGAANGVATLDATGKVPANQLPSFVDDVLEFADLASFPATGESGKIYVAIDTGKTYRWSGSVYTEISASEVNSVNGQTGVVVLDTDDVSEGTTNLYYTDERSQDSVGSILVDSASIDLTYDDVTPSITAVVLPAGVDHDALANFVANEHIDHSSVEIQTGTDSGLTGGGDITSTRSLSVDINGTTAETVIASGDELLIYDVSASALKKITRANLLAGIATTSSGDIAETTFAVANNQSTAAPVTGLAFANGVVRSFDAHVSVEIDAGADVFETFRILGIQKNGAWDIAVESVGDESLVEFTITAAGQLQYTSAAYAGFVSGSIKFRAVTTSL